MERTLLAALATYRLTKLVLDDEIVAELRQAAYDKIDQLPEGTLRNKLNYFLGCPWCVSIWAAASLFILSRTSPNLYNFYATTLGLSAVTGIMYERIG